MTDESNKSPPDPQKTVDSKANNPPDTGTPVTVRSRGYTVNGNGASAYEEYLYGAGTYRKGYHKKSWNDTTQGRSAIRLVSRGLFGAAAFTAGGLYAGKVMNGGSFAGKKYIGYDKDEFVFGKEGTPVLHYLAKGFDVVLGEPIAYFVRKIAPEGRKDAWATEAVTFRHKGYYHRYDGHTAGRSLGAEMVTMTFDFASSSVGDATARNLIQSFDPALQKPWEDENGHFDPARWAKTMGRATWRILTKNQGEDWAAALPYVYQMKFQRQAIANYFPGFKLTSDRAWNGGSMRLNKEGKIVGDYQLPGLLDLQFRFAGYNWYTLMFRETYDSIGKHIKNWQKDGFQFNMPNTDHPVQSLVGALTQPIRYAAKSFIKAHIYMVPAVPFFWVTRTPQSKWKASPIMLDEETPGAVHNAYGTREPVKTSELHPYSVPHTGEIRFGTNTAKFSINLTDPVPLGVDQGGIHTNPFYKKGAPIYFGERQVPNVAGLGDGDAAFKWANQKTLTAKLLNPFGWVSYKYGSALTRLADKIDPTGQHLKFLLSGDVLQRELRLRNFADASIAYTPYFIAKTELGLRVDDRGAGNNAGKMDTAIYKVIDNIATFNIGGVRSGLSDIGNLLAHQPKEVKSVEGSARRLEEEKPAPAAADANAGAGAGDPIAPAAPTKAATPKTTVKAAQLTAGKPVQELPAHAQTPTTVVLPHARQLGVDARRNFVTEKTPEKRDSWGEQVTKDRSQQLSVLMPPHRTVQ